MAREAGRRPAWVPRLVPLQRARDGAQDIVVRGGGGLRRSLRAHAPAEIAGQACGSRAGLAATPLYSAHLN